MNGLLRDNFYAAYANEKVYFIIMFLVGIVVAVVNSDTDVFIRNYMLICLIGFSFVALDSLGKDGTCRWEKYKLTVPVTRANIVKSCYIGQLIWIVMGILFSGMTAGLSILLHGIMFDRNVDIALVFIIGTSISLFMGAVFFPLFYLCGDERKEAVLVISILSAIALAAGLVWLVNALFGPEMPVCQILLSAFAVLICAVLTFGLSYVLTVGIFRKKEY